MDVFDTDSDYANHPPPTDSEAEYEPLPVYVSSSTSLATMSNRSGRPPSNMLHSRNDSRETLLENEDLVNQVILFGISSTATTDLNRQRNSLKELGLKRLSPREHIAVAICRDFSLLVIIKNLAVLWHSWYTMMYDEPFQINVTSVRASEFFLAGIWCMVSGFLSYSILDGLMVRWIVMPDPAGPDPAAGSRDGKRFVELPALGYFSYSTQIPLAPKIFSSILINYGRPYPRKGHQRQGQGRRKYLSQFSLTPDRTRTHILRRRAQNGRENLRQGRPVPQHADAPAKRNTGDGGDQGAHRHDHWVEIAAAGPLQHQAQAGDRLVPGS
ncbi:hypothetical protein KL928_001345 [Ogataea angusta]|uniref:Uncharacterized protein n=1 Tax=Pichia angusta TaxID=870730 RepID=A0AAN6DLK8_PICAN|nr:uncharacterized protein KL928_001345 [Ogataea angusta]KAG7821261.1 hypothetical protein KL928_001345 [Ogataea angusta]